MNARKPILGFGRAGWCLLPAACALAWVYFSGYDLRFKLMEAVLRVGGIKTVYWIVVGPLFHQFICRGFPGFGIWGLTYGLAALFVYPRPVKRVWWIAFVVWPLLRAEVFFWLFARGGLPTIGWLMHATGGILNRDTVTLAVGGAVDVAVLSGPTRSWVVALVAAGAMVPCLVTTTSTKSIPEWVLMSEMVGWHALAGGALLVWAIRARIRGLPEGLCRNCEYDLRGAAGVCPECGTAQGTPAPAGD